MSIQDASEWDRASANYADFAVSLTSHFARLAVDRLNLRPGELVLDVACGPGTATRLLAEQGAVVEAIDFSGEMIARLKRDLALAIDRGEVAAQVMDGQNLNFADETFDAAVSTFGVILFADFRRGMTEMRRVVRDGGRVAFTWWPQPDALPYLRIWKRCIREVVPSFEELPLPGGWSAVMELQAFAKELTDAGFRDVDVRLHEFDWTLPDVSQYVDVYHRNPFPASVYATLPAGAGDVIREKFREAMRAEYGAGEFTMRVSAHVAFGKR